MLTRKNVWELGKDWADPILWYARGVAALKARSLTEPTSWRFYAAIHGFDERRWRSTGNLATGESLPSDALVKQFWNQCQHGSWYFLPWHRGYVWAFETVVRAAIVQLKGPADWTLPYWNYFKPDQNGLPPAFASRDWPDGQGNNPLFVPQRYGPNGDGNVFVVIDDVNLNAMADAEFTGVSSGGSPGFGGVDTGFAHSGSVHGDLESQPHDWVHVLVGGSGEDGGVPQDGLMSDPRTAGLDPIFWLHHANIDRLWEVWREHPSTHLDPTESRWRAGPASTGEHLFEMPLPGGKTWPYTPEGVATLSKLEYTYDDLSSAPELARFAERLRAASIARTTTVASNKPTELLGASHAPLPVQGSDARTLVQLDKGVRDQVVRSFAPARASLRDRVFLNLENIRGQSDATAFRVYVGLPSGAAPDKHPEHLAGNIALFGVSDASAKNQPHGGSGLTFVLEVSDIMDTLQQRGQLGTDSLDVRLVPIKPVPGSAQISIGRISLFRQAG